MILWKTEEMEIEIANRWTVFEKRASTVWTLSVGQLQVVSYLSCSLFLVQLGDPRPPHDHDSSKPPA